LPYDEDFDPLETTSGLPDDFDATIEGASFLKPEKYPNVVCQLVTVSTDPAVAEQQFRYPCGPLWETYGGATVEHQSGRPTKFNNKTRYGRLIDAASATDAKDVMRQRIKEGLGGPTNAAFWLGLAFHWKLNQESGTFKDKDTGQPVNYSTNTWLPTRFLGATEVSKVAAPDLTTFSAAGITVRVPENMASIITALARTKNYEDWVDSVVQLDGVASNSELVAAIGEEKFYTGIRS
jgi:hypothetical protein